MSSDSLISLQQQPETNIGGCRRMKWRKPATVHTTPPSMKNHTSTLFRNDLIVFGGFDGVTNNNRVHAMNVETGEWRVIENIEGVSPAGRNGHTATLANGKIYYIGGWLGVGPLGAADVHALDPITWTWSRVATSGQGPGPCNMHTADYIELNPERKLIFLFRGGDGRSYLNDLHTLDVERLVWEHPHTHGRPPPPRANHSSAVYEKHLIIFGGWDGTSRLHDMHVLDASTLTWSCPETKGIPPTPRAGSTLTCVGDGLILFGGSGPHSSCFNDVHFFDPRTLRWTKAEREAFSIQDGNTPGQMAAPKRARMGYDLSRQSSGGQSSLQRPHQPDEFEMVAAGAGDDNPNVYHQSAEASPNLLIQGEPPEKRAGHTATLVGNRKLLIVGGSFQTEYLKSVFELDIDPPPQLILTSPPPSMALVKGIEAFYNNDELSDVVFIVENQPVYCHRIVLATQSEWFKVLFSRGFREANEREIKLDNVPLTVFKQLIAFFYLGERAIPWLAGSTVGNGDVILDGASTVPFVLDGYDDSLENSQDSEVNGIIASAVASANGSTTAPPAATYLRRLGGATNPDSSSDVTTMADSVVSSYQHSTVQDNESAIISSICDLYLVADQFICEHLRERCEITLARRVNTQNVKQLQSFATANRATTLAEVCHHFEKWGRS